MKKTVLHAIGKKAKGCGLGNTLKHTHVFGSKALDLILSGTC